MRVHIATDHAAFELKEFLVAGLRDAGYDVVDHGAKTYNDQDDYPDFVIPAAEAVAAELDQGSMGIVLGRSGNGEQIAANKVKGIRAAWADTIELAQLGRQHNNANVLSLGGRVVSNESGLEIAKAFLETKFTDNGRHLRRINKIRDYENR